MASSNEDFTLGSGFSPKPGTSKLQGHGAAADASPDSKCPICLDRFDNVSHLDQCLHRFCFRCIQEWAKNKAECPLCKQPFHSIFHSVRAEDDFKEYVLRPTMNGSFASPEGHRFRYRTTLTRDYAPRRTLRSSSARRTFSPPDNGILFEGITNTTSQQRGSEIHQMLRRLASRRQASAEGRSMRQIQEQELINFRRALYRSGVRVRNIQDGGRYRDISAEFFRRNPACLHRLVPWLKRELTVLFGSHGSLVNIVQHIIMSNVTRYDLESQAFIEDLRPFLLHRTDHFLHEFINFARCPYNIEAYDQHANYDCPAPSYEEGSHSESSIITISPDDVDNRSQDIPESSVSVGQAPWDDETPGPSYSIIEQPATAVSTTVDLSESSDDDPSSSRVVVETSNDGTTENKQDVSITPDDCVIVGYVKPLAERTPELVELSSDSESSLCEVKCVKSKKPQLRQFISSDSNVSSRSSSPSSSLLNEKMTRKANLKENSSSVKHSYAKKKERKKPLHGSTKNVRESSKDKGDSYSTYLSRRRARSRSSDCYSRSSRNKGHDSRRRHHSKTHLKSRHKSWRGRRRSRSRDRSLSWRSRTVSLTSESSRERGRSSSRSRNHSRGRSRSRDNKDFTADNYRSTYQWEYTYYSRNRGRDGNEQSYKRRACGLGRYSRPSDSTEYYMQSYSERKGTRRDREHVTGRQHHRERRRSRSHSGSQRTTSGTDHTRSDKPSGKRKYKTRHLENQEKDGNIEILNSKTTDEIKQSVTTTSSKSHGALKNDFTESSSQEPKPKLKKKTRSPSVEIVYEGKAMESSRHHKKKKKKKHKKKRHREQTPRSPAASPIIITIDSDSETPLLEDPPRSNIRTLMPVENSVDSTILYSQSPSTSATVSTTDLMSVDRAEPPSTNYGLCSNSEHIDDTTGILDGLHFDSSDEQTLAADQTFPLNPTRQDDSSTELDLLTVEAAQGFTTPSTPSGTPELQELLAENGHEIEHLENIT
ncbi:E3 ubiquitin- ligase Topors [Pelobates cultripes]|uniref:E3 ubiquitin-protein ligase Topors n=1 Tax=Pelobates cultripes TaxID=61616 RepID=A0AAD1S6Z6_PELCU|nr:E3 ubiquitin- ligase Topors [Pelobates cultripes]